MSVFQVFQIVKTVSNRIAMFLTFAKNILVEVQHFYWDDLVTVKRLTLSKTHIVCGKVKRLFSLLSLILEVLLELLFFF